MRITPVDPDTAEGRAGELLDDVQRWLGMVPNLLRIMANSPAVLQGYLAFSGSLTEGVLPARLREQIALAVSERNGCHYCLAVHTALGKIAGLSREETLDARHGRSADSRAEAALLFAQSIVDRRGSISDQEIERVRSAGYDEDEIVEIVAHVALSVFTNYFNRVAETAVDFPAAPALVSD